MIYNLLLYFGIFFIVAGFSLWLYAETKLREILKVYHYKSDEQHISKDVVTSLENLLGSLLK